MLGSDNQIYSVGLNEHGEFGNGTTVGSSTPVKVPLPAGLTVTEAWADAASLIMRTSSSDLYSTGCNAIGTRCDGMLGTGSSADVLTAQKVVMPAGTELFKLDGNNYSNFGFTTRPKNAVGGNVYCDANGSGAQDIGESLVNGETVTLYPSAGGVVSGAALATYTTEEFNGDGGVFFFDNLLQGEYIIGFNSVDGELFSEPVTLSSAGDGWILGSSKYIATASAVGQTGFVCGASTTIPSSPAPTPSTPGTPSSPSLSNTGTAIYTVLLMAGALLVVSTLLVTRHIFRTAGLNR